MKKRETETARVLRQWNDGDRAGLEALLDRHLPWIRSHVRKRLGPALRSKEESGDFVQDAVIQFLRYGPRMVVSSDGGFRALLMRIVENSLRNRHDWYTAQRRAMSRENPLLPDTVLYLDPPRDNVRTPSQSVALHEDEAWVRLGIELLDAEDREVIVLRQWEEKPFAEIGELLGISDNAARMRYNRAVGRLADKVLDLRQGDLEAALV